MKKKILFLITKTNWGGAQKYVFDLASHLPKDQFDVSVAYGTSGKLKELLEGKNIATHHLSALGRDVALWSDIKSFVQLIQLIRRERPDIVHLNSSKAAALGALAGRVCRVPRIIFTVHGWPFKEDRSAIACWLIHFISWFTALLAHATIVVSKTDEEIGNKMFFVGKKIHYIPLGIEPPIFLRREEASTALSISTTNPRIVTIGELTKNKGHRYAIDAIAELSARGGSASGGKKRSVDVEYFIIGDGELRAALEQRARELNVSDRIHFLGFVENAALYLKAFDIFLLPSIKEGTPYVLLEAATAGLPIIATDAVDAAGIQVPAKDASAIADAVLEIQRKKMVNPAPATLENMLEQTSALYNL